LLGWLDGVEANELDHHQAAALAALTTRILDLCRLGHELGESAELQQRVAALERRLGEGVRAMRAALMRRVQRLERQTAAAAVAPWWATPPLAWALLYDETLPPWQAEAAHRACRVALERCGLDDGFSGPVTADLEAAYEDELARLYPVWAFAAEAYAEEPGGVWSAARASDELEAEREVAARHRGQAVRGRGVPRAIRREVEQVFLARMQRRLEQKRPAACRTEQACRARHTAGTAQGRYGADPEEAR
jgi:hypothetical protein